MTFDSSLWNYFINAGMVVKIIMILLVAASILSWSYIMQRAFYLKKIREVTANFESQFWLGGDLASLYQEGLRAGRGTEGIEAIFQSGFKEFLHLQKQKNTPHEALLQNVQRAMRVAQMREQDKLELQLPILATIGSISPYVGLFGTVWGIMLSFRALANVQQATISMVAPGIAEALIATAMGLFAAIPAVVAYNRFTSQINQLLNRFDSFQDEFSNIIFRQSQGATQPKINESQVLLES